MTRSTIAWDALAYRPGLDLVRAVAVSAVFVFHARHHYLPGGHLGVDLFFALSGFLISGLLLSELEGAARLELVKFYGRRIVRLFPALLVLVVTLFAWGKATVLQSCAALFYFANIVELRDGDAAMKNLLHTWSLSTEEQFYLVWPVALILLFRLSRLRELSARVLVAVLALAGVVPLQASGLRMGTLLAGAALGAVMPHLVTRVPRRRIISVAVVSALVLLTLMCGQSQAWWVQDLAVPLTTTGVVAGAALLDWHRWAAVQVLKPMQWVGRISYGLYLWHLPLYFLLPLGMSPLKRTVMVAGATLVTGAASWYFVERPISRTFRPRLQPWRAREPHRR